MIKIIYAKSLNDVIGKDNRLPWRIPSELDKFKEKTMGHTVVMGRKTFESLPVSQRPLPGRNNVVVTTDRNYSYPGIQIVTDPIAYIISSYCQQFDTTQSNNHITWIIGGLEIFRLAMNYASEIHVTLVQKEVEGDVFAPPIDKNKFRLASSSEMFHDIHSGIDYYIDIFRRY